MTRATYGHGSVIARGPRKYTIRWSEGRDPFTGQHIRRTLTLTDTTLTEARRVLATKTAARRSTTRMTLGDLLDVTLAELDVTERTRDRYRLAIAHIPPGARVWRLSDITVTDAAQLIKGLTERTGAATVVKAHTAILSCWKQGYRNGWVQRESPFHGLKLPEVATSAGQLIDDDAIKRLMAVADPGEEEAWLMLSLGTGARPGEVRTVRWSDVDLDQAVVTFTDTKHHGRRRPVAIGQTVVDSLEAWREMQAETRELVDDPYLFSNALDGSVPWSRFYAGRDRWGRLRDRAGLPADVRLYDLRHTVNSHLAASDVSRAVRGMRAGNSPAVNDSVYTHQHPLADREAAEVTDRWLR
jgi:integrase